MVLGGVGSLTGVGLCVLALGLVFWRVKDAEPVWIREEALTWVEPLAMVELDGGTFFMGASARDSDAYEWGAATA